MSVNVNESSFNMDSIDIHKKLFPLTEKFRIKSLENFGDNYILINGNTLSIQALNQLGYENYKIRLDSTSEEAIKKSRDVVENIIYNNIIRYGINTGIGKFATTIIPNDHLNQLQLNIVRSHSSAKDAIIILQHFCNVISNIDINRKSGVGKPLTLARAKMLMALRINILAKGYSGITLQTMHKYIEAFNKNLIPYVPEQGTVGASGDLCQLAHLALSLIGENKIWNTQLNIWDDPKKVMDQEYFTPIELKPKEGIALINGTCFITALGAEAVHRAESLALQATIISALTLESLKGSYRPFDARVHNLRPFKGQKKVADILRLLLETDPPSEIGESHHNCKKVQDSYTLRCIPQVHGIVFDTIEFAKQIITVELNSANDNPLVFPEGDIISCGNFHGEYPAKALDFLAIAIHELASISERRIEQMVNADLSHLPPFLTPEGGINSGFMMAHVTAASLVSENKVLCHPSSVDSIPTSASKEDHVSMGGFAARKILNVLDNVENVLAIELMCACQALEFLRPLKSTGPLEHIYDTVREHISYLSEDRVMWRDIAKSRTLLSEGKILNCVMDQLINVVKDV